MHANPDSIVFVSKNIDVMISTAHGAELVRRHRFQIADRFHFPRGIFEQFVLDAVLALATNPERNVAHNVVHDLVDLRRDLFAFGVGSNRQIPASDVETDTTQGNLVLVSNNAADRLRVTFVTIRAKHGPFAASRDTGFNLLDRCRVVLAENFRLLAHAATYR